MRILQAAALMAANSAIAAFAATKYLELKNTVTLRTSFSPKKLKLINKNTLEIDVKEWVESADRDVERNHITCGTNYLNFVTLLDKELYTGPILFQADCSFICDNNFTFLSGQLMHNGQLCISFDKFNTQYNYAMVLAERKIRIILPCCEIKTVKYE
jgi:hypothetical protein